MGIGGSSVRDEPVWRASRAKLSPAGHRISRETPFRSSVALFGSADAAGRAQLPIPPVAVPDGLTFYMQYATDCPSDAAWFVLTPLYQVMVTAP